MHTSSKELLVIRGMHRTLFTVVKVLWTEVNKTVAMLGTVHDTVRVLGAINHTLLAIR